MFAAVNIPSWCITICLLISISHCSDRKIETTFYVLTVMCNSGLM